VSSRGADFKVALECPAPLQVTMGVPPAEEAAEPEILAKECTFSTNELRWQPSADAAAVTVRLDKGTAGKRKMIVGSRETLLSDIRMVSQLAPNFVTMQIKELGHVGLQCEDEKALSTFVGELSKRKADYERFEQYDASSVQSYFQYYAKLANQQNMLQDTVRTSLYRHAIVSNPTDFADKVIMDIGAGSGILSFFSCQAGAATVYAVEASSAAETVRTLADANKYNLGGANVVVVNKPLETIGDEVPEKVDALVSEPIGTFLFNERMIESYICARDRFLKPGGKMFPNVGNLMLAPFSDTVLHGEQQAKNQFWNNNSFYGLDLTAAMARSTKEHFSQPIVDYVNPECLMAESVCRKFDFATVTVEELQNIEIPFDFEVKQPCLVHGLAGWFDALFEGTDKPVTLSTAPWCPGTHWYQIRFLLETPLAVNAGQRIVGWLKMDANNVQSYYIRIHMGIKGTEIFSENTRIDLKDPEYRFFSSQAAYVPPGTTGAFGQEAAPGAALDPAAAAAAQAAAAASAVVEPPPIKQRGNPATREGRSRSPKRAQ